jgi:hypothetical protein
LPPFDLYSDDGPRLSIPGREFRRGCFKWTEISPAELDEPLPNSKFHGIEILLNKFFFVKVKADLVTFQFLAHSYFQGAAWRRGKL